MKITDSVKKVLTAALLIPVGVLVFSGCLNVDANLELKNTDSGGEISGTVHQYVDVENFNSFRELSNTNPSELRGEKNSTEPNGSEETLEGEKLFALSSEEREELESLKDTFQSVLSEPETVNLDVTSSDGADRGGSDTIGIKIIYDSTPLQDYRIVAETITAREGGVFPQFEETTEGYKVTMMNPFYGNNVDNDIDGQTGPQFAENMEPDIDITIQLPAGVNDTNTPQAVSGNLVGWNNETLKDVSGEKYLYANSQKSTSTFPVFGVALLTMFLTFVLAVTLVIIVSSAKKTQNKGAEG